MRNQEQRKRLEKGASFLEFALVIPLFLVIIYATLHFLVYYSARNAALSAAQRALSKASVMEGLENPTTRALVAAEAQTLGAGSAFFDSQSYVNIVESRLILPNDPFIARFNPAPLQEAQGLSTTAALQQFPMQVVSHVKVEEILPFMGPMEFEVRAVGYQEPRVQTRVPRVIDCYGNPIAPGTTPPDPEACRNLATCGAVPACDPDTALLRIDKSTDPPTCSCQCQSNDMVLDGSKLKCVCAPCPPERPVRGPGCSCTCAPCDNPSHVQGPGCSCSCVEKSCPGRKAFDPTPSICDCLCIQNQDQVCGNASGCRQNPETCLPYCEPLNSQPRELIDGECVCKPYLANTGKVFDPLTCQYSCPKGSDLDGKTSCERGKRPMPAPNECSCQCDPALGFSGKNCDKCDRACPDGEEATNNGRSCNCVCKKDPCEGSGMGPDVQAVGCRCQCKPGFTKFPDGVCRPPCRACTAPKVRKDRWDCDSECVCPGKSCEEQSSDFQTIDGGCQCVCKKPGAIMVKNKCVCPACPAGQRIVDRAEGCSCEACPFTCGEGGIQRADCSCDCDQSRRPHPSTGYRWDASTCKPICECRSPEIPREEGGKCLCVLEGTPGQ